MRLRPHPRGRRAPRAGRRRPSRSLATFAGEWAGHTRGLVISHKGRAVEQIDDGCCDHVADLTLQLSRVRGTTGYATARAVVVAVRFVNAADFSGHPPFVGETRRILLRHGIIHERITGTIYCGRGAANGGACGA